MKCIDPWLLNNRRQCPVCKRYVFPNPDESEEDDQGRTATERTPLLRSNDEYPSTVLPRNREIGNIIRLLKIIVQESSPSIPDRFLYSP